MERIIYDDIKHNEDLHWWFIGRRKILQKVLSKVVQHNAQNRVLEIGCGSGGNLQLLSTYGQLYAMEYDRQAREAANKRNICRVEFGELPDNIPFSSQFDLICLLDVLEHLDNDSLVVGAITEKLNPGGLLIVTVPAYQFLWSSHDVANHHKRRYTKSSLKAAFKGADVNIRYISYFNCFLFPPVLVARFLNKIFKRNERSDIVLPSPPINKLLKTIFAAERYFIPHMTLPFGVSILAIAEKTVASKNEI